MCLQEKKAELIVALEEEERRMRVKAVGNIRFIGELYKLRMLTAQIMFSCVGHLLSLNTEEALECLCKLLTTIGLNLEEDTLMIRSTLAREIKKAEGNKDKTELNKVSVLYINYY